MLRLCVTFLGQRLVERSPGRADIRFGALRLRCDIAVVEPRDDIAGLDARAFGDTQPLEAAGCFRSNRRLALRDDIAGRVEHHELLRRICRHDGRRLHRLRARLQREPAPAYGEQRPNRAEPDPFAAAPAHDRRQAAIDPQLREIR